MNFCYILKYNLLVTIKKYLERVQISSVHEFYGVNIHVAVMFEKSKNYASRKG